MRTDLIRRAVLITAALLPAAAVAAPHSYDRTGTLVYERTVQVSGSVHTVAVADYSCSVDLGTVKRADCLDAHSSAVLSTDEFARFEIGPGKLVVDINACTTKAPRDLVDTLRARCDAHTNGLYLAAVEAAKSEPTGARLGRNVWPVAVSYRLVKGADGQEFVAVPSPTGEAFYPVHAR